MNKYSYEEVKDYWIYASGRLNNNLRTQEHYINHTLKKFSLNRKIHGEYLIKYYKMYKKENKNGRENKSREDRQARV